VSELRRLGFLLVLACIVTASSFASSSLAANPSYAGLTAAQARVLAQVTYLGDRSSFAVQHFSKKEILSLRLARLSRTRNRYGSAWLALYTEFSSGQRRCALVWVWSRPDPGTVLVMPKREQGGWTQGGGWQWLVETGCVPRTPDRAVSDATRPQDPTQASPAR
jgi:hypothetical protein